MDTNRSIAIAAAAASMIGVGCAPAPRPPAQAHAQSPRTDEREIPPAEQSPGAPAEIASAPAGALGSEEAAYRHLLSELHVGFYRPRHKDNKTYEPADGYLAPVARASAGGFLFGGQVELEGVSKPVLGKIDSDGEVQWLVPMDRSGYKAYEGGLVNETPDGHCVGFIMAYPNPARNPVLRFAKITPAGEVVWQIDLPRDEHGNSAQIHIAQVADDGSLRVQGHLYRGPRGKKDRPAYRWSARITPGGELTDESTGAPIDWATDEW